MTGVAFKGTSMAMLIAAQAEVRVANHSAAERIGAISPASAWGSASITMSTYEPVADRPGVPVFAAIREIGAERIAVNFTSWNGCLLS